jgi:hypothetical protein
MKEHVGGCQIRVLRRIFGTDKGKVTGSWRKLQMRSFIIYTLHEILLPCSNDEVLDRRRM